MPVLPVTPVFVASLAQVDGGCLASGTWSVPPVANERSLVLYKETVIRREGNFFWEGRCYSWRLGRMMRRLHSNWAVVLCDIW